MSTLHLEYNSELARKLAQITGYTGRNFRVIISNQFSTSNTYWDEGTKNDYLVLDIFNNTVKSLPSIAPFNTGFDFSKDQINFKTFNIPVNFAIIEHSYYRNSEHITLYINPANSQNMLPEKTDDLTYNQKIVLYAARAYKSSYANIADYRFYEAHRSTNISKADYQKAKDELIKSGYLDKRGAITVSGRNAIEGLYNFPDK